MSKGLAIIHDPHNLYQFVWYYCSEGKNKKWDALCLPNGYKGEYMHTFCEKAAIFENIFSDNTDFSLLPTNKKLNTFLKMTGSFLIGKRDDFCRKLINKFVNYDEYDEIVVIADVGVVTGACVALGKEKKVVILEDGLGDYGNRSIWMSKTQLLSSYAWQGFFLSLMGYCSPEWYYFKPDKYCIKYSSNPDKMKYTGYKEIRQLYSNNIDDEFFNSIVKRMYPEINDIDFDSVDVVLFSTPIFDYVVDCEKYIKKLETYIGKNYHNILLKKHPRDSENYSFGDTTIVQELDNSIPAEAIIPYITDKKIIITIQSSMIIYLTAYGLRFDVVELEGIFDECCNENTTFTLGKNDTKKLIDRFAFDTYNIVKL